MKALDEELWLKISDRIEAAISPSKGLISGLQVDSRPLNLSLWFVSYNQTSHPNSGAYLFYQEKNATDLNYENMLQWVRVEYSGLNRVRVCSNLTILIHCVEFHSNIDRLKQLTNPTLRVWNLIDLRRVGSDYELVMLIRSDGIRNNDEFYTDLNGFQFIKRKVYLDKLKIQGNVYPMASGAFIQDKKRRMT